MDPKASWVGFNMVRGIGAVRMRQLISFFGNLETAWNAPADGLLAAGLTPRIVENLVSLRNQNMAERAWEYTLKKNIQVLTWDDAGYPQRLLTVDQPPPVLYVRGTLDSQDDLAIALVGTRRVTGYGRQVSGDVAAYLAANGVTVVSGLARGVDGIAHAAALDAGGRTIAVLGCGVDIVYPPEHRSLAERIIANGALVADYAPGTPPDSANFPPRNRIISGLCMGVVVVEAGERSGALITAEFAAEQGREVFAVPGAITAPQSKGTNRLIRDGATPLLDPQDVLTALNLTHAPQHHQPRLALPEGDVESQLYQALRNEPLHVDDLCERTGLTADKVAAALVMMELKGMVRGMGGMQYSAIAEERGTYET